MRILHAVPLLAVLCAGCASYLTPPGYQRPTPDFVGEDAYASRGGSLNTSEAPQHLAAQDQARAEYFANMKSRCAAYGYVEQTPEFANCMMQVDANMQAAQQANIQQRRAAILGILANQPATTMPQATFTPMQTRPTINTNCQTLPGGYVSCTSR